MTKDDSGSWATRKAHIDELFARALELDPRERTSFLEQTEREDEAAAREVRELLGYAEESRGDLELDHFHSGALWCDLAGELGGTEAPEPGARLGAYRLLQEIGRGGMGIVFLAERADGEFEQQVAVKVLRGGAWGQEVLRRFEQERSIMAALSNPRIARLFDGGRTQDGHPYFVLEYVEGLPIDRYCDVNRLSLRERLELFQQVGEAVSYAHRNLIVHRDLKPSNIVVTSEGLVKLLDFGIAKLLPESAGPEAQPLTRELHPLTPEYASPEQWRGERVSTAADIYQLGLLLYELLTGWRAHRPRSESLSDWERAVCVDYPDLPSTAVASASDEQCAARRSSAKALTRQLRGNLDNIVAKALRKEPDRRYGSVEHLLEDTGRHLGGFPVAARPASLVYRAWSFAGRHRVAVTAAAMVALSLVGGLGVALWQAQVAADERDVAQWERDRSQHEAEKAEQATDLLIRVFEISNAARRPGEALTAREVLEYGSAWVDDELVREPEMRASMLDVLGRIYMGIESYEEATPFLERALELRREVHSGPHPEVARSMHHLGRAQRMQGNYEVAKALISEALEMQLGLWEGDHPEIAYGLSSMSYLPSAVIGPDTQEALRRESLSMRRRILGEDHLAVAQGLNDLGWHLAGLEQLEEAEALLREALEIQRRALGSGSAATAASLSNLATVLRSRGNYVAAEEMLREAIANRRAVVGMDHPAPAKSLVHLGGVLYDQGQYEAAALEFEEALRLYRSAFPDGHIRTAHALIAFGRLRLAQDLPQEAEAMAREAVSLHERYLPDYFEKAWGKGVLGAALTAQGDYAEAERELEAAVLALQEHYGVRHSLTRQCRSWLLELYEVWDKPEKSLALLTARKPTPDGG